MAKTKELESEVRRIKERNTRVEADKAWETSLFRKGILTVATYLTVVLFLVLINAPNPWLNGAVPAGAFALSTLTLPPLKEWWIRNAYGRKG